MNGAPDTPIRIGNGSGYYGDRLSAMRDMLEGGPLDYLTGDYLAELTMLILGKDRLKDPELGYAKTFVRQMRDCMALAKTNGVRIVTNAGGLNPAGLAGMLRQIAAEQSLDVAIAHIEGDDLSTRRDEFGFGDALTANAYLGAFGIAEALQAGADIVVTGRVTDASLTLAPAIAEFGWQRTDYDELAGGIVAGHVIECGAQATGGNFSGFDAISRERPIGFPLAEISPDGSSVITKHPDTGGLVSIDTVTAQLVYEIQSETYLNPDAAVHLDSIELADDGPDRVRISQSRGSAPPHDVKVCLNMAGGYRNSVEFVLTGLEIPEKARWVQSQLETAFMHYGRDGGYEVDDIELVWTLDRTDVPDPSTQVSASSILRCYVTGPAAEPVGRVFSGAAVELALASYPGFTMTAPPGHGGPIGIYRPAYIPQQAVAHRAVMPDGTPHNIAAPAETTNTHRVGPSSRPRADTGTGQLAGRATTSVPLGRLIHARSGDKGGDANLGVWIGAEHQQRGPALAWLVDYLTAERVRELLPETQDLRIDIFPLPNLAAINIVIAGLLGEGVASSTRFDPQAKALGEWLRARYADIPTELLP